MILAVDFLERKGFKAFGGAFGGFSGEGLKRRFWKGFYGPLGVQGLAHGYVDRSWGLGFAASALQAQASNSEPEVRELDSWLGVFALLPSSPLNPMIREGDLLLKMMHPFWVPGYPKYSGPPYKNLKRDHNLKNCLYG